MQEIAFTLANGLAYCRAAVEAGLSPDDFGERLSFFFNAHNHFFQEVAKFRAARRLWAKLLRERFGATNEKALALRFHAQTGGSTLTAQQPENNIVRVAIQALAAACGGAQSLHTNSLRRGARAPDGARGADRAAHAADPPQTRPARPTRPIRSAAPTSRGADRRAGGSARWELIERVEELGGAVAAIEAGFVQREIEEAAFRGTQRSRAASGSIVGVNAFHEDEPEQIELHRIDPETERRQLERTARVRAERNADEAARRRSPLCARVARHRREPPAADARGAARALHGRRDLRDATRGVGHVRRPARLDGKPASRHGRRERSRFRRVRRRHRQSRQSSCTARGASRGGDSGATASQWRAASS